MLTIGTFHFPSVLMAFISWSSFYLILRGMEPHRKAEWHCRIVTAVHAILISFMTAWATFIHGPWPFTDAGGPNTPLQITAITICLGYFFFDTLWCLYFQTEGLLMMFHHFLSILGLFWTLCSGKYGTEMVATICGSEITNPLLQLRWFLKELGHQNAILAEIVDLSFMIFFFLVRIGVGTVLIYCYFQQPTDLMGRFGAVSIYLISWMFWIGIVQYAFKKYSRKYYTWRQTRQTMAPSVSKPVAKRNRNYHNSVEKTEHESIIHNSSHICAKFQGPNSSTTNGLHLRSS